MVLLTRVDVLCDGSGFDTAGAEPKGQRDPGQGPRLLRSGGGPTDVEEEFEERPNHQDGILGCRNHLLLVLVRTSLHIPCPGGIFSPLM